MKTKTIVHKSAAPIYAAVATWLLYALLFPLYAVGHFLLAAAASAVVALIARMFCRDVTETVEIPEEPVSTGNVELDKMIAEGDAAVKTMRMLNDSIQDEKISAQIDRLEAVSTRIFDYVKDHPEKLPQIRKFMSYYLPTTLKLLSAYADFEKQTVVGDNIRSSKANIERMMETLSEAYEKQFDSLFRAESMDINAEIRTMDSLLRQDGYVGGFTMPTGGGAARGAASGAAQVKSAGEKDAE